MTRPDYVPPGEQTETKREGTGVGAPRKSGFSGRRIREWLIEGFIRTSAMTAILILALLFVFLIWNAAPVLRATDVKDLLTGRQWYPISHPPQFGLLPLICGSLLVTFGALVIAVPVGVACATYIAEVAPPWAREILKPLVELLAAVPSVVIGFVALELLAPRLQSLFNLPTGMTALTGAIALAFMALPTIVSVSEDAIRAVPVDYRRGSWALGATEWQTIHRVTLPAARSGIVAAIMLGIGRAIGETMTVLMVTGNAAVIPHGGLAKAMLSSVRTMTATIAAEMGEVAHGSAHYHALFAIGVLLLLATFILTLIADIVLHRGAAQRG